jgi:hypothetical protein
VAPDFNIASSSVFAEFNFKDNLEEIPAPLEHRMSDHIAQIALQDASIKLLENKNG